MRWRTMTALVGLFVTAACSFTAPSEAPSESGAGSTTSTPSMSVSAPAAGRAAPSDQYPAPIR